MSTLDKKDDLPKFTPADLDKSVCRDAMQCGTKLQTALKVAAQAGSVTNNRELEALAQDCNGFISKLQYYLQGLKTGSSDGETDGDLFQATSTILNRLTQIVKLWDDMKEEQLCKDIDKSSIQPTGTKNEQEPDILKISSDTKKTKRKGNAKRDLIKGTSGARHHGATEEGSESEPEDAASKWLAGHRAFLKYKGVKLVGHIIRLDGHHFAEVLSYNGRGVYKVIFDDDDTTQEINLKTSEAWDLLISDEWARRSGGQSQCFATSKLRV